ncbi:hypothetical protein [Mucilaginibacter gynuensis]|uniref:hypothetical protein n=1 Tax=Mucilaginibacter gynuensis TaxID=1302236 RepID=UPI0031E64060
MKVENPAAFRFILDDDIYLLNTDKQGYVQTKSESITEPVTEPAAVAPPVAEEVKQPIAVPQPVIETPKPVFKYLGRNKQRFLILVNYADADFMQAEHLSALENTIKRKALTMEDVIVTNLAKYPGVTITELSAFFKPKKLLVLGQTAMPAAIAPLTLNQPETINGIPALLTFSFNEMMTNNDYKKAFWEQVKNF